MSNVHNIVMSFELCCGHSFQVGLRTMDISIGMEDIDGRVDIIKQRLIEKAVNHTCEEAHTSPSELT